MTFLCPTCMDRMKPLFTGFFCPNDCDRRAASCDSQLAALLRIAAKVPSQARESFIERSRGLSAPWYVLRIGSVWCPAVKEFSFADSCGSEVILRVLASGKIEVLKSRGPTFFGVRSHERAFDAIPDSP